MTQPYQIKTVPHMGLFIHTLRLYKVELEHAVTRFQTPPDLMVARLNRGNNGCDVNSMAEVPRHKVRAVH